MSFRDWLCILFNTSDIDVNDLDTDTYYTLEDIYYEEVMR